MKSLIFIISFLTSQNLFAQEDSSYLNLLNTTNEITLTDSLLINTYEIETEKLDTNAMKKWFFPLLSGGDNNRLKKREYFLIGKITTNNIFDLLLVAEEKNKKDSTSKQIIHLVSTKKDGTYISSMEVAISGLKNDLYHSTFSWLYNDKISLNTNYTLNDSVITDMNIYKINRTGRFLLAPKY